MNLKNQIRLWHITVRWKQKGKYFNKDYIVTASSKDKAEEMARDRTMTPESMEDSKDASFRVRDLGPVTNNKAYYASDINVESLSSVHEESALNNTIISFAILWGQEIGWRITHDPESAENKIAISKLKDNPRMVQLITSWAENFMKSKNTDSDAFFKERMKMYLNTGMTSDDARPITDTEYKQILKQAEDDAEKIRNDAQQQADEQLEKISEIARVLQRVQDISSSSGPASADSGKSIQISSTPDTTPSTDSQGDSLENLPGDNEPASDEPAHDTSVKDMEEKFLIYQRMHGREPADETSPHEEKPQDITEQDAEIIQKALTTDTEEEEEPSVTPGEEIQADEASESDSDDVHVIHFDLTSDSLMENHESEQSDDVSEQTSSEDATELTDNSDEFFDDDSDAYDDNIIEEDIPEEEIIDEDEFPPDEEIDDEDEWESPISDDDDNDITESDYQHMNNAEPAINHTPAIEQPTDDSDAIEVEGISYNSVPTGTLKDVLYQIRPEKLLPFLSKLDYIIDDGKSQATLPADEWVDHLYHKNLPEKPEDYTKLIVDVLSECQPIDGKSAVRYVYDNLETEIDTSQVLQ